MAEDIIAVFKAETSQYEKALNDLKQNIKATEKSQDDFEKTGVDSQKNVAKATADTTKATQELGKVGTTVFNTLDKLTLGAASSIRNMVTATAAATKGMNILKVAIASTGIGALVLAVGALVSYFTQTQRGADAVKRAFAGLEAGVKVLVDRMSALGETIINAFRNPEAALKAFADSLRTFVTNRVNDVINGFTGLGRTVKLVFEGEFTKALEVGKQAALDLTTGLTVVGGVIKDNADSIKGLADEIINEASAAADLEAQLQKLRDAEINLGVERAKARAQIKELNLLAEDVTKSNQERLDAASKAIAIEQDLQKKREDIAKRRVEIIKQQQALGENLVSDNEELAQAEIELANIAEESLELQTTLNNKLNVIKQQMAASTRDQAAAEKELAAAIAESGGDEEIDLTSITAEIDAIVAGEEAKKQAYRDTSEEINNQLEERLAAEAEASAIQNEMREADAEAQRQRVAATTAYTLDSFGVITDMYLQQSQNRLAALDREIETSTGLRRSELEQQREIETRKIQNIKRAQLAVLAIQEAVALARAFAELGPVAGTIAAAALAVKFAFLFAQVEEQSFYEGTDYLTRPNGVKPGRDTIPIWANEGEAIIPTKENLRNRGLVKALVNGDVEKYIHAQYVLPQLQAAALSGMNGGVSIDLTKDNQELISAIRGASRDQIKGMSYTLKQISKQRKSRRSAA